MSRLLKKTIDRIKFINAAFLAIEFLLAMFLGIVARIFSKEYLSNLSFSYLLIINYSFSGIGILVPGYYYRLAATRSGELRNCVFSAKIKFLAENKREFSTFLAISCNRC